MPMVPVTVYLYPLSTFKGRTSPRSDTLFGALCWGYRLLFSETVLKERLKEFEVAIQSKKELVPFLISSCFLFTEDTKKQRRVHYLPKPISVELEDTVLGNLRDTLKGVQILKELKQKKDLSEEDFNAVIQGQKSDIHFIQEIREELNRKNGPFLQEAGPEVGATSLESPHNAINRLSGVVGEGRLFYHQELAVHPGSGFFFCLKCRDEAVLKDLKQVIYFLGDRGIGGESSVGKGQFKPEFEEGYLPFVEPSEPTDYATTLSLTYPDTYIRLVLKESYYELEKRQGKIESMYARSNHIWKDALLMLKEGSTIKIPNPEPMWLGANPIVRTDVSAWSGPSFDVRHYGLAFLVKTKHVR